MATKSAMLPGIARLVALAIGLAAAGLTARLAAAGPPFRTDDPEPVGYQNWEVNTFSTGTHVAGQTTAILPGQEFNYGATSNLQLHVIFPFAYNHENGIGTFYGYGDTELGFKYRFLDQDKNGWRPEVGIFPLLEVPTGNAAKGLGSGHVDAFLPLWLQKDFGRWTTYGGGGYWINPGVGNKNFWFFGWLLQRQVTDKLALGAELFHQTAATVDDKGSTGFNGGGIYDFTDHFHLLFSAGRGIQNPSSTNEFSYYVGFLWTFKYGIP